MSFIPFKSIYSFFDPYSFMTKAYILENQNNRGSIKPPNDDLTTCNQFFKREASRNEDSIAESFGAHQSRLIDGVSIFFRVERVDEALEVVDGGFGDFEDPSRNETSLSVEDVDVGEMSGGRGR